MIDTSFDFRTDALGRDPDKYSPTLRRYHRQIWSRRLPNGELFDLIEAGQRAYLLHRSRLGEFVMGSDSVIPTYTRWKSMQRIIGQVSAPDSERFRTIGYTIGAMMIFPSRRIDGKQTINGARGFNRKIADRLDLTLECIRRHDRSESSPMSATLSRYSSFFSLFEDFRGYVEFFLLQDLTTEDFEQVRFLMLFDDFATPSFPTDLETYLSYRERSIAFVKARNDRISRLHRG